MANRNEPSELLKLLHGNAAWNAKRPSGPCYPENAVENASLLHARANKSDPFAQDRMRLHLSRCLDLPSDVSKEAQASISARQSAIQAAFNRWKAQSNVKAAA